MTNHITKIEQGIVFSYNPETFFMTVSDGAQILDYHFTEDRADTGHSNDGQLSLMSSKKFVDCVEALFVSDGNVARTNILFRKVTMIKWVRETFKVAHRHAIWLSENDRNIVLQLIFEHNAKHWGFPVKYFAPAIVEEF